MQWGAVNRNFGMIRMLKVFVRLGITKIIDLFSVLGDFRKQEDMSSSGTTDTGNAGVVGVLDIALLAGSVLIVVAIILKCRRKSVNDETSRLKELKINTKFVNVYRILATCPSHGVGVNRIAYIKYTVGKFHT